MYAPKHTPEPSVSLFMREEAEHYHIRIPAGHKVYGVDIFKNGEVVLAFTKADETQEVHELGEIALAGIANPSAYLAAQHDALETELRRWQDSIRDLICDRLNTSAIDGAGCDSGDPLDLTLTEVGLGLNILEDENERIRKAHKECVEALRYYADCPCESSGFTRKPAREALRKLHAANSEEAI